MVEPVRKFLQALNHISPALGSVLFRNNRFFGFTADRLLYLWLHRCGLMGKEGLREIEGCIRPGMTVVDVGANVGIYTAGFSRLVGPHGKVVALEPAPTNLRTLLRAREVNEWSNVDIHGIAASDREGTMALECSSFNSGNNALSNRGGGVAVRTVRLDSLLAGTRVDFLKIDVQGWEAAVLRGAVETLRRNRPIAVRLEIWPKGLRRAGSGLEEILEILASCGLEVVAPRGEELQAAWRDEWYFDLSARAE
jgi:FkbM family methyltransferase